MKIYNSISTKTFTTYVFLIFVIKTIIITTNVSALDPNCKPDTALNATSNPNAFIVGFFRGQSDPSQIRWDAYTHIIYAYPSILIQSPQSPQLPQLPKTIFDDPAYLNSLTAGKKNAKIIAAIGNYSANTLTMWNAINESPTPSFVNPIVKYLQDNVGVDGVDIEYPKTECAVIPNIHTIFDNALKLLKDALENDKLNKSITVTFGPDDFINAKLMLNIKNSVNFVNIIGYHLNVARGPNILEGPTSPFESPPNKAPKNGDPQLITFKNVANNWKNANILDPNQLVMGVEFSGIVRKVENPEGLKNSQNIKAVDGPLDFPQSQDIENCDPTKFNYMKSIAWNKLNHRGTETVGGGDQQILTNDCQSNGNAGWTRKFETNTKSTYLYNNDGIYISYEDPQSLQYKVNFLKTADGGGKYLGGIMISDISADNDVLLSIVNIKGVSSTTATTTPTDTTSTSSDSSNPSPAGSTGTNTSTNTSNDSSSQNTNKYDGNAALIGIIIGSIIGAAAIVGGVFLWWNYKRREQMSLNKSVNSNDYQNVSVPVSIIDKAVPATPVSRVTALYDFEGKETTDLSFKKGDIIEVIEKGDGANDWWVGKIGSKIGEFPGNYVRE